MRLLPSNINFPFISHIVTPYIPVPESQGAEWDRLEPIVALDALIELVVIGEYGNSGQPETTPLSKDEIVLRTAGASVFQVRESYCVRYQYLMDTCTELHKQG